MTTTRGPLYDGPTWGPMVPDTCPAYWEGLLSLGITAVVTATGEIDVLDMIKTRKGELDG
jgi:hypothetical protein